MNPFVVTIPHPHGKAEAIRRIKAAIDEARSREAAKFKVAEEKWDDGHLDYRIAVLGQSVTGRIDVADDNVRAEVQLTWLMEYMAEQAEALVKEAGSRALA
jgi:hypothetical protein